MPGTPSQDVSEVWESAVWLSGNAFASNNVVALRHTRLIPGWYFALFLLLLHPPGTLYLLTFDCAKTFSLSNVT